MEACGKLVKNRFLTVPPCRHSLFFRFLFSFYINHDNNIIYNLVKTSKDNN